MTAARRFALALLALATTVSVAACGSNNSGQDSAAAAAVSQSFMQTPWYSDLTSTQTGCLGTGIIKDFGIKTATHYGFLADGNKPVTLKPIVLPAADAAAFTDTFITCTDAAATIRAGEVQAISNSDNTSTDSAAQQKLTTCVNTNLTPTIVRAALLAGFEGKPNTGMLDPVLKACSSSYQPAGSAIAQSFLNATTTNYGLTSVQASCLGDGIAKNLGTTKAIKYGLLGKNNAPVTIGTITLPTKDATTLANVFIACVDPATTLKNGLLAKIPASNTTGRAELAACLDKKLTPALLRKTFTAVFSGDSNNNNLDLLFSACGSGS